jgi:hypothetical protein
MLVEPQAHRPRGLRAIGRVKRWPASVALTGIGAIDALTNHTPDVVDRRIASALPTQAYLRVGFFFGLTLRSPSRASLNDRGARLTGLAAGFMHSDEGRFASRVEIECVPFLPSSICLHRFTQKPRLNRKCPCVAIRLRLTWLPFSATVCLATWGSSRPDHQKEHGNGLPEFYRR